jgi:hypothetical protein
MIAVRDLIDAHHWTDFAGYSSAGDEAVIDPTDLYLWKVHRAACVGRWCVFAIDPYPTSHLHFERRSMGRPSSDGRCDGQPTRDRLHDRGCALCPTRVEHSRSQRLVRAER